MLEVITKYWLQWLCGIAATAIAAMFRQLWKKQKDADKRQKAVENGIQALLRDRIVQTYYHYADRQSITLHGLQNVEALYREYHTLGGNGTVTKLVDDLRQMEVRDG